MKVWVVTMVPKSVEAEPIAVCSTEELARGYAEWYRKRWNFKGKLRIVWHKVDNEVELEGLE